MLIPATCPNYQTIEIREEAERDAYWLYMHTKSSQEISGGRNCFTQTMLDEIRDYEQGLSRRLASLEAEDASRLHHFIVASRADVFNLGGDLEFFARCIQDKDRDGLLHYARECVRGAYSNHTGMGLNTMSIALIQGAALGGGFECALSCQLIVAERGSEMGLPEVLFDLFPGMGAYSFLSRRIPPVQAERMILGGRVYSAEEMHAMGVVDVLAEKGEGERVVRDLITKHRRIPNAVRAMHHVRAIGQDVSLEELMRITEVWVETALRLPLKSLKTMGKLASAQRRRSARSVHEH